MAEYSRKEKTTYTFTLTIEKVTDTVITDKYDPSYVGSQKTTTEIYATSVKNNDLSKGKELITAHIALVEDPN